MILSGKVAHFLQGLLAVVAVAVLVPGRRIGTWMLWGREVLGR